MEYMQESHDLLIETAQRQRAMVMVMLTVIPILWRGSPSAVREVIRASIEEFARGEESAIAGDLYQRLLKSMS